MISRKFEICIWMVEKWPGLCRCYSGLWRWHTDWDPQGNIGVVQSFLHGDPEEEQTPTPDDLHEEVRVKTEVLVAMADFLYFGGANVDQECLETTEGNQKRILWARNICEKEDQKINIKSHIEANHITSSISYSCDVCGKASRSKTGLRFHKARQHSTSSLHRTREGLRFHKMRSHKA